MSQNKAVTDPIDLLVRQRAEFVREWTLRGPVSPVILKHGQFFANPLTVVLFGLWRPLYADKRPYDGHAGRFTCREKESPGHAGRRSGESRGGAVAGNCGTNRKGTCGETDE